MAQFDLWQLLDLLRVDAVRRPQIAAAPAPVREGRIFAHILQHLPLGLSSGKTLAGEFGPDWCTSEQHAAFAEQLHRLHGAPRPASVEQHPAPFQLLDEHFHCRVSDGGHAHTTVDYARIVTDGIEGVIGQIECELKAAGQTKREVLEGMRAALQGLVQWAERYAALADSMAQAATDEGDRQRLLSLAERCRRVPRCPARTLREATQAIWFIHLGTAISEHSGSSLSLGRLDQYLFPLYSRELAQGATEPELERALIDFFRELNTCGDPACTVNLGPADPPEHPGAAPASGSHFNALSRTIIEVVKQLQLPSPLLAARITRDTPPEIFDLLTDPGLLQMGQPTFYGEEPCRRTLERRGVRSGSVPNWAANSCMGLMMPGQEWSNMWGSVINVLLPLELALNRGQPFHHELPLNLSTATRTAYDSFDDLFDTVCAYTGELVDLHIHETARRTARRAGERPNPFVSALLDDGIVRGRDRLAGGCRYHTVIVEAFGLVNSADALLVLRQLLFEQHTVTLDTLVRAARHNFDGHADLLAAIQRIPKYGNGHPQADGMARRLADRFAQCVSRHSNEQVTYAPSFHTLSAHIVAGARMGASLDGRRSGEPLAKNIGSTPGTATSAHTALMRSAAAIDQTAFCGGQALDISIDLRTLDSTGGRRAFQALLQTYFRLGGLQVQANGVGVDTLRAALAEPHSHRHVLVRKAGFTTRYVTLPRVEQEELIERFCAGL